MTDSYLLSFSPYDSNIYYFGLGNRTLVGSFSVGEGINYMVYLKAKGLLVYATTSSGKVKSMSANIVLPVVTT